jgi:hypothetical protein
MTFWFAIPLRSRQVSASWDSVVSLLDSTVSSALHSNSRDVRVIIACNELPDIKSRSDSRVEFIVKDYPVPQSSANQMLDKRFKKYDLASSVLNQGGGYMMLLDSDDLVSRSLVSFIETDNNMRGYSISHGYIVDKATGELVFSHEFSHVCGSSVILYLDESDRHSSFNWPLYISVTRHQDFLRLSKDIGRSLDVIDFPAALAIKNNGENHSFRFGGKGKVTMKQRILSFLSDGRSKTISSEIAHDFGYEI